MNTKTNWIDARYTASKVKLPPPIFDYLIVTRFIVLLMFATFQMQAQDNMTERLLQIEQEVASGTLSDEEMFVNYRQLIDLYNIRDFEKSKMYFQKGIDFARAKKREEWEAQFYGKMGYNYLERSENDTFLIYMDKVIELIEGKEHYLLESQIYGALGNFYSTQFQLEIALITYHKSLEIIEKDKNKQLALKQGVTEHNLLQAYLIVDIGTLYYDMRNLEKAVEYMLRAKQILDENPHEDNPFYEIIIFENLAQFYMEMGQTEKVLPLALKAYGMATELEYLEHVVFTARLLSDYYRAEKDLPKALRYAKEALQIAEETELATHLNWADMAMMETNRAMKDYQTALYYAGRMAERTEDDDWDALQTLYKGLIIIYSSMGNPDKTEENLTKLSAITAKISDRNLHNSLQEMEVKYEVAKKDLDIERQQTVIERQRSRLYLFIGGLIALVMLLALVAYTLRLRTRRNLALTQRNEALSAMNTTKDKFFSIISHDLKNPAVEQRDALQILANNIRLWDTDTLSDYANELLQSAEGHVGLIFDLLGWARLQTGRITYTPVMFLLSDLLADLYSVRKMAANKQVHLSAIVPDNTMITGDRNIISTTLRNLLTNAVKFTPVGGTVSLTVDTSTVRQGSLTAVRQGSLTAGSATATDGKCSFVVSDTGVGMSREQIQNLFRLDSAQSRKGTSGEEGTGLGLIVCKELLEKHETTLNVESEEGKGSRFWFEVRV